MTESPADILIFFFCCIVTLQKKEGLCKHNYRSSASSFPALPTSLITTPSPKPKTAAVGPRREGQVMEGELSPGREAGRQQQRSSSRKKKKLRTRGYVCSLFSTLEIPLTSVRTSEKKPTIKITGQST